MKNMASMIAAASLIGLLAACSGGSDSQDNNASAKAALPPPTPMLKGVVEIGAGETLPAQFAAVAIKATPKAGTIPPISTGDPRKILSSDQIVENPWKPGGDKDLKLVRFANDVNHEVSGKFPTGKWSKAFFYQSPNNLDAYFEADPSRPTDPNNLNGDTAKFSIYPFPNRLRLDDRNGMVRISFPKHRYINYNIGRGDDQYDMSNPYVADAVRYPIAPSTNEDMRLLYVQPDTARLTRQIDGFDELNISTTWINAAGDKRMTVLAAEGSPFVTLRYANLRPVVQVGQGIKARRAKDELGNNKSLDGKEIIDYRQEESDNAIKGVAVDEQPLQPFTETGAGRNTPQLKGTKFRFLYQVADRGFSQPGTNNDQPVNLPMVYKEAVLYTSREITLQWDIPSRSYVAQGEFSGIIRTAFTGELSDAKGNANDDSDLRPVRQILDRYAQAFPTASHIQLAYDGGESATVTFQWDTERMDGQTAQAGDLLMMGFDATHLAQMQNPNKVSGLSYLSNFGSMSAIAGDSWTQKLTIPAILRTGSTPEALWQGSSPIKAADRAALQKYLTKDTQFFTAAYTPHCNFESYQCGKYLYRVARLVLIADELGDVASRQTLLNYLRNNLVPWFDGKDPTDPDYVIISRTGLPNPIKENIVYDTVNGGIIALRAYKDQEVDYHNAWYVDHMFHYGYYIYASAVLAAHDTAWLAANREKVNLLVRDIANPSLDDPHFPLMRHFDWYRMQNLADSGPDENGPNTESVSESIHANYALALWGATLGNSEYQALAAIMTAGEIRTAQAFYQLTPDSLPLREVLPVDVSVTLPNGSGMRRLATTEDIVRPIVRANTTEFNTFFSARLDRFVGIELLPISPISEYVISTNWLQRHADALSKMEQNQTALFKLAIENRPTTASLCFLAGKAPNGPVSDRAAAENCAAAARLEYAWRQILFGGLGLVQADAYDKYLGYAEVLAAQEAKYGELTKPIIGGEGIVSDVLKSADTPTTDTDTLWWLSARKPN